MYKFLNNLEEIHWHKDSTLASNSHEKSNTSDNRQGLVREHFPSKLKNDFSHFVTLRYEFFTIQVTTYWNKLPKSLVKAPSLANF